MSIVRTYKRSMAKHRMDLEGFRQVNKHGNKNGTKSYFASHWREYLPSYKAV